MEAVKKELEKGKLKDANYKEIENNYKDLQKRNKDLVITINKMKNDNLVLTQYIDDLAKQKKKLNYNIAKLKKSNKEMNDKELQEIKIKYKNLENIVEEAMKENEKYKKEKRNWLI